MKCCTNLFSMSGNKMASVHVKMFMEMIAITNMWAFKHESFNSSLGLEGGVTYKRYFTGYAPFI